MIIIFLELLRLLKILIAIGFNELYRLRWNIAKFQKKIMVSLEIEKY
jgi:hypothetical protein